MNTNCCGPPEAGRRPWPHSVSRRAVAATSFSSSARRTFFCRFRTLLAIVARWI